MKKTIKPNQKKIIGAILAGGKSKRMGFAKEKLCLPDGRTMIEHVRDNLFKSCEDIVISGGNTCLGHVLIKDKNKNIGPIGGILSVLESGKSNSYLVVPCDLPFFNQEAALPLIKSLAKHPEYNMHFYEEETGQLQFLPCVLTTNIIGDIEKIIAEKKYALKQLANYTKTKKILVEKKILPRIRSVNTKIEFTNACNFYFNKTILHKYQQAPF